MATGVLPDDYVYHLWAVDRLERLERDMLIVLAIGKFLAQN